MDEETPKDSSKEQKSDQAPATLTQAFVQSIWRSRWRTLYLIVVAFLVAAFSIWKTLPESSRQQVLTRVVLGSRERQEGVSQDQGHSPPSPTSLAHIERAKLRFGLSLGWQIARFEFVDGSPFPEAQAAAPTIKNNIADLLSADGFPHRVSKLGYRDLIQTVLTYYGTTDAEKHSAILVGIAAFRTSLVGASKVKANNLAMERLAFSAIQEIDPCILPGKDDFFQLLLRKQPRNIPDVLTLIDSMARK